MGLWCHGLLQNINAWTNCIFKEYCQFQFMYFATVCSNKGWLCSSEAGLTSLLQWLGYGLLGSGFKCRKGQEIFMFPRSPYELWGSISLLCNGYRARSWGTAAGAWGWSFIPPTAKFRNGWSYISTPPMCLHGVDRENLNSLPFIAWFLHYEHTIRAVNHIVL
jgi:hypothetical protein